jgi:hypothetical protein
MESKGEGLLSYEIIHHQQPAIFVFGGMHTLEKPKSI